MVKVTELIEMGDKNVFNTTGSKLWQKIVLLFDAELKAQYSLMRQDRFTVDNIMKYLYDEQISQIPAYYYNKDMQSKYLNFGSSYLYALHGSGEQHIRKWIRERLMYVDTLLGYRTSSSDYITLRSSKLGEVYLDIETYIPMYVSVKWRDEANNTGLQTKRVGRGEKVRFTYNMPTATDQEIIVYAGHYLKRLGDVSNLQPTSMLIANADRLTEIECHSPNLINTDLSECTKLQRIDLSDCTALGTGIGAQPILNIQNCKYLRYCNCMNTQLTAIYTMQAGGNLEEIYYPQSTQVVQLTNQTYLHTVGLPSTNPCENLADVMITNCNAIKTLSSETTVLDFNTLKYVQNLNITNSLNGLNSMHFNGFDKLRNVTLSSLKELDSIGFEDMMPVTTTSTLKNITISDCPLITSLSFNVSSEDYKVAFASNGKLDLGGLQSLKSIKCNTSVKGLDTLIVPTSLTDLRFTTEYGDGINEIKNIWSASAVHNNDGFEGIDFQDMTIEFIDMLGLNGISNAINFHIAPKTQNPNLNTARDGSVSKPWFHPTGSIDLSNYTGLMIGMLRGVDLNKLDVVINTDRDQTDLTSLFECATLPTAQNIVTKTNNILAKFPKSVIWDYMFKGCDLSFSPKDITIPNRGLSLKGMYKDSNVTEDVSLPNVVMAVDEMFMNCTGITTYEKNWLKTYAKLTFTVPTSNGTSGSWDDNGNYTEGTNYNQFLYTPSDGERAFKIMTTGTGVVRINYFYNASFMSRIVYTPEFDSYPYVVTIPDGCNKVIFVCDKTIRFASEGTITTSNCYTNTGGALSEIPVSWGGYGLDKNVTSIYVIDTTHLTNTTTFNLVSLDNQAGITDWGDGVTNSEKSHTYAEHGVYTIKTKSWANGYAPSNDLRTALIEVKQIKLIGHNGNSKNYSNAFNGCSKLTKVTAYNLTPTNCNSMFNDCSSLTEIIGVDTWDMSNCYSYNRFLCKCKLITYDTLLKLSRVLDFSKVNGTDSVENMFNGITFDDAIPLQQLNTSSLITLRGMLNSVKVNGDLDLTMWDVSNVTNLSSFLSGGANIQGAVNLGGWNTSKVTNFARFLYYSSIMTSVNLSGWDFSNNKDGDPYWFIGCNAPDWDFTGASGIKMGLKITNNSNWSVNSLVGLFNALYDFSTNGGTHTLAIGTNITKLTREQILIAIKKHWNIQGASIRGVFRDTDISTLTSDDTVTAVAIELTADNYLTRIDEVLGVYTNAVDVYFFDDGSVTTLDNMCYENNTTTKDRIKNVTFLDGYFENCTSFKNTFRDVKGLLTVTGMPDNVTAINYAFCNIPTLISVSKIPSKCTIFNVTFRGCKNLTSVPVNGWTGNLYMAFMECPLLNQQINVVNPTDLSYTFYGCSSLEISPTFTGTYTGAISYLFGNCRKLTKITLPTTWTPSSAQNTFSGCTNLVTIENLGTLDMSNCTTCVSMFDGTSKLTSLPGIENWVLSRCTTIKQMFNNAGIVSLDVSNWGMGACTDMSILFNWANNLTSIVGLDNWDISSCTNFMTMFNHCISLSEINLSNWDFTNVDDGFFSNCTSLTKITLNNIVDNSTREAGVGLRNVLNSIPRPVEIVMNEFAMTDFSNLFQGVTKIKNDIVFPTNTVSVTNCFKDCTGMTYIHSNWNTEYGLITGSTYTSTYSQNNIYWDKDGNTQTWWQNLNRTTVELKENFMSFCIYSNGYVSGTIRCTYFNDDNFISRYDITLSNDSGAMTEYGTFVFEVPENCNKIILIYEDGINVAIKFYTTDCYSGCTSITNVDGIDLELNEYTTGLDDIPRSWGGYEFNEKTTGIYVFNVPSDNYNAVVTPEGSWSFTTYGSISNWEYINGYINWGDGTITYHNRDVNSSISHTYATAGTYTIKGQFIPGGMGAGGGSNNPNDFVRYHLLEVKQQPSNPPRGRILYNGCEKLRKVTAYNFKPNRCDYMFHGCSSLTEIIGMDTWDMSNCDNANNMFAGCNVLGDNTFLTMSEWDVTKITSYYGTFQNCKAMTNINFMSSWNMSNCRELGATFQGCTGLIEIDLSNRFLTGLNGIRYLCADCTNLQTINLTNLIDKDNYSGNLTQNTYATENPFNNCTSLQNNPYLQIGIGLASISFWSLTCVPDILDLSEIDTSNLQSFRPTATATQIIGVNSNFPWGCSFRSTPGVTVIKDLYYKHSSHGYYYYNGAPAPNTFINFATREGSTAYKAENFGTLGTATCINNVLKLSSTNYNVNTFISLFNCLYDYASEGGSANFTLTLGEANLARLTDEQIATATNKGWTIQ